MDQNLLFIGGGNMARAIIGGLLDGSQAPARVTAIEPDAATGDALQRDFGVQTLQAATAQSVAAADVLVWAVKPQIFKEAAAALRPHLDQAAGKALHISVAAGITTASMRGWLGSTRVVRTIPNTPALIRKGMTALFAAPEVSEADRQSAGRIAQAIGQAEWVEREELIDSATALSGSGPAYVFYFLEAMQQAGAQLGLPPEQAYRLALATFEGASALAAASDVGPEVLRQRVSSKGGTTLAATNTMDAREVKAHFVAAMQASCARAAEMAREFG